MAADDTDTSKTPTRDVPERALKQRKERKGEKEMRGGEPLIKGKKGGERGGGGGGGKKNGSGGSQAIESQHTSRTTRDHERREEEKTKQKDIKKNGYEGR